MILVDTSGLLAWIDPGQRRHGEVVRSLQGLEGPFVLSPFVLAELDYLLMTRLGPAPQKAFLEEVARGAFELADFSGTDVQRALAVMSRYRDLDLGLADSSIVVLADRLRCNLVLTLDERHFRVVQTNDQRPLRLLPSDA